MIPPAAPSGKRGEVNQLEYAPIYQSSYSEYSCHVTTYSE